MDSACQFFKFGYCKLKDGSRTQLNLLFLLDKNLTKLQIQLKILRKKLLC